MSRSKDRKFRVAPVEPLEARFMMHRGGDPLSPAALLATHPAPVPLGPSWEALDAALASAARPALGRAGGPGGLAHRQGHLTLAGPAPRATGSPAAVPRQTHRVGHLTLPGPASGPVAAKPPRPTPGHGKTPAPPKHPAKPPAHKPPGGPTIDALRVVAVGGTLQATIRPGGLAGPGVAYTIDPQPLPANATFDRGTGAFRFAPAPGQAGHFEFTVTATEGARTAVERVPVAVVSPRLASTEVAGRVVDEAGRPLAGVPVMIGAAMTETNAAGNFVLKGVPANPGPLTVDGLTAGARDRMMLMAPVAQALGHPVYAGADNVVPTPIVLPRIDTAHAFDFSKCDPRRPVAVTDPALPGLSLQFAAGCAMTAAGTPFAGKLTLTALPAAEVGEMLPAGVTGTLVEFDALGLDATQPVRLTVPNTGHYAPGSVLGLWVMNGVTGAHDLTGRMVVSADGRTISTEGGVALPSGSMMAPAMAAPAGPGQVRAAADPAMPYGTAGCFIISPTGCIGSPGSPPCGCGTGANGTAPAANTQPSSGVAGGVGGIVGGALGGGGIGGLGGIIGGGVIGSVSTTFNSDANLATGEYLQDHPLVAYQSQGQARGLDLQYSSLQADPLPVVQYDPTTQAASDSSAINSVTAGVSVGGVSQGAAVTYNLSHSSGGSSLADGQTYRVPLQLNATQLASGVYPYYMSVTQNYSGGATASSTLQGDVDVANAAASPLGAGWSIGGLQQLSQVVAGGPVLITSGSQGAKQFDPKFLNGPTYLPDLAVATGTGAQVFANDNQGNFAPAAPATAGTGAGVAGGVAAGDFNGDGLPDLAEIAPGGVSILLSNGHGGFTAGSSYTLSTGYAATVVAVGNFTGHTNGVLDLAVLEEYTYTGGTHATSVEVWTGSGTGTFTSPIVTQLGYGVPGGPGMAVGDFNGDGMTDLAVVFGAGSAAGSHADIILAAGGGSMTDYGTLALPAGHQADAVAALDYNGDGKPDLVVAATNTNVYDAAGYFLSLDLFQGTGPANINLFTATSSYLTPGHPAGSALVTGNFLSPTDVDVAVAGAGDGSQDLLQILPVGSNGTWQQEVTQAIPSGLPASTLVAADLNGDGRADLALASDASGGGIGLILSNADSNQMEPLQVIPISSSGGGVVALAVAPFAHDASVPEYKDTMGDDPSTLIHNAGGTWTRTSPDGTVVQFNAAGQETSATDRNGNATTYAYVPAGQPGAGALKTMTDPVGLVTTLAYNAAGHLSTVTDPAGRVTTFTVDSNGNLTKVVDPDGAVTQYGYATPANHEITTEVNPDSKTATAHYDSFGQLHSETLFDGTTTIPIGPADEQGLLAPGGSSSTLPSPAGYAGTLTDADGRTTTMALDMMSNPTAIQDPTGARTTIAYDMMGRPAAATDGDNRTTAYTYNMNDDVTQVQRPDFTKMTMAYGVDDQLAQVVDFKGQTTTYSLDAHGNVLRRTDPDLGHEDFTYNAAGQVLTDTDRNGHATTYTYDSYGRLTRINYPFPSGGSSPYVAYGYDAAGDVTTVTDELGHVTTMAYDPAGRLLSTQDPVQGAAGPNVKTAYGYDPAGNLMSITDALGHQTTYAYDARNREVGMTDPADQGTGRQYTYGYDGAGNLTSVTDPLGFQTTFAYDGMNRQVGVTDPTGARTTYAYDGAGQLLSVIDPDGNPTTYTYDQDGRLQTRSVLQAVVVHQSSGGSGGSGGGTYTTQTIGVTTYAYDADNNLAQVSGPQGEVVDYGYDALNRRTSMTRLASTGSGPSGGAVWLTTTYGYDAVGNRTTVTDPDNHTTTSAYDERNRLVSQTDPSGGGTTTYAYDAHSRLLALTDPDHNTTSYGYDNANRVTTVTDPMGHVTTTARDVVGNVTGVTDRDNRTITYAYDADNREVAETWYPAGGGAALRTVTMAYDADGRLTSIKDPSSDYAYTYDKDGRVLVVDNAGTPGMPRVLLTYAYDPDGNRTSLADNSGGTATYAYDLAERLTGIGLAGTGLTAVQATMAYDTADRLTGLTRLSGSAAVGSTTYAYDLADRLTGLTHANAAGGVIASYAYTLDTASRLTQEVRTWANPASGGGTLADTLTYAYTNNNQLTGVAHTNGSFAGESFGYDANGNRNTTGYDTPTDNELTSDGTYTYSYDNEGNLVSKTAISGGNQTLYTYDDRNRLTEVDQVVGGVHSTVATYTYDALGRQIGAAEGGAVRWTAYDGQTPILDFTGSGAVTARYLSVPGAVDQVLARETSGGVVAWYLADRLGTVRDLVSNSGGLIDHVDYGAFGNVVAESSPGSGDRFKFAGMELDAATGQDYDRARWYDPKTGRFTRQDPAGFTAGTANLYQYSANDSPNRIDVSGLAYIDIGAGLLYLGGGIQVGPGPCNWIEIHPYWNFQYVGAGIVVDPFHSISPGWFAGIDGGEVIVVGAGVGGLLTSSGDGSPSPYTTIGLGVGAPIQPRYGYVFGDINVINWVINELTNNACYRARNPYLRPMPQPSLPPATFTPPLLPPGRLPDPLGPSPFGPYPGLP